MNVYQTDHEGFYVGEAVADVDPRDNTNHLIPAGCVTHAPPTLTEGQLAQWVEDNWVIVTVPVEEDTELEPVTIDPAQEARDTRNSLLETYDWTQLSDAPVDQNLWAEYRSLLRDITTQSGFPSDIVWPIKPE
tara:strand:+ start:271 stop:669 length:399 start_codon:yes stop_codon:yes gene_type:complete